MSLSINKEELFTDFFDKSQNRKINYLVLHHIEDINLKQAIKELKKHQVSSHYIIDDNGKIFQLVEENNIAYHAGISYWNGQFNLNSNSIGIEFFSTDPYKIGFSQKQTESGIKLCQKIVKTHRIMPENIVGHSDIAYNKETGFLNRKNDPSFLFPWQELAQNRVGIYPEVKNNEENNQILFKLGDKNKEIKQIKEKLANFGYKIDNFDDNFDEEFKNLTIVFNRRFNSNKYLKNKNKWFIYSSKILEVLV